MAVLAITAAACTGAARPPRTTAPGQPLSPVLDFATPLSALAVDDVAFVAEVWARELRFDVVPTPVVTFSTTIGGRTVYTAIRHNLPKPVLAGVTYRDVRARVIIATSLPSVEHALEALEAVPLPPALVRPPSIAPAGGRNETR